MSADISFELFSNAKVKCEHLGEGVHDLSLGGIDIYVHVSTLQRIQFQIANALYEWDTLNGDDD